LLSCLSLIISKIADNNYQLLKNTNNMLSDWRFIHVQVIGRNILGYLSALHDISLCILHQSYQTCSCAGNLVTSCGGWHSRDCTEMLPGVFMTWLMFFTSVTQTKELSIVCTVRDRCLHTFLRLAASLSTTMKLILHKCLNSICIQMFVRYSHCYLCSIVMIWLLSS
jgi:hypothetical protein